MPKSMLEPNKIKVKVMFQETFVFFLDQGYCFKVHVTDARGVKVT